MQMALDLAAKGKGSTSPNPMVGAVVVKGTRVIAAGWHKHCGADHAEIVALKKAGARERRIVDMAQGQKKSRLVAWTFRS